MPLVTEARNWTEGVYMAATMGSETTAAAFGQQGVVRRDPFAMLPFMGYNMSDYFQHWLGLGKARSGRRQAAAHLHVNWFRKGEDGKFVWPGYGENMRVLKWMIDRIEGKASGTEPCVRHQPHLRRTQLDGPGTSRPNSSSQVTSIDKAAWGEELELHAELFQQLAYHLPAELTATKAKIEQRLAAWKRFRPRQKSHRMRWHCLGASAAQSPQLDASAVC